MKMLTNFRLNMLNREAASPRYKSTEIIKNMDIQKGDIIADIGTGGGYFTFKFSIEVGIDGKVYALDTNQKSLDFVNNKSQQEVFGNIKTVIAEVACYNKSGTGIFSNCDSHTAN